MAGRKQHFIPRHFLKSFVINDGSDKLWMYRRGLKKPVPVSRDDAAATRDFYSKPSLDGSPTLDDLITDYETHLQFLVDKLRGVDFSTQVSSSDASEVVAHLTMRTAYLRELIGVGASEMASAIDTLINNPTELLDGIRLLKHRAPSKFAAMATEEFQKRGIHLLTNISTKAIVRLLYFGIREDFDLLHANAIEQFADWVTVFEQNFTGMGQLAHTKILQDQIVPTERKRQLETLTWQVVKIAENDAPLADCVAIAKDENGWGPYLLASPGSTVCVILPLSPSKVIVGSGKRDWSEQAQQYTRHAVESCFSFYLSDQLQEKTEKDLSDLGHKARETVSGLTSSAIRGAIENFVAEVSDDEHGTRSEATVAEGSKDFSYSVSLKDFANQEYAQKVANAVNEVVLAYAAICDVKNLDGITFAVDYEKAIAELDRGDGHRSVERNSTVKNANGVALPILVHRQDGQKTHLVMKAYLAEDFISEIVDHKDAAVSLLLNCLGTVTFNSIVINKFPDTVRSTHKDEYEGWLAQYNDTLLSSYFSISTTIPTVDMLSFYSDLAVDQLEAVIALTREAGQAYELDGDHEKLFQCCASSVSSFLTAITRVIAAQARFIGPKNPETALLTRLSQVELLKWADLFAADMSMFIDQTDDWWEFEETYFINRHFERLLFEVGVFPDQLDDGSLYIHTSGDNRLNMRLDAQVPRH
jgi:hypothetical protein